MNKIREAFRNNKNFQIFIVACGAILFYVVLNNIGIVRDAFLYVLSILWPVICATILAFIINPIVQFFEQKVFGKLKYRKAVHLFCVIFTVVMIVFLILLLLYLIVNQLSASISNLIANSDQYVESLINLIKKVFGDYASEINIFGVNLMDLQSADLKEFSSTIITWCTEHISGIIGGVTSVGSNVLNTFIMFMLVIYMLLDVEHLSRGVSRYFRSIMEPENYISFANVCTKSSKIFIRYLLCNILDSLIVGVACYLFMIIMGLPYPLLIAVEVGVTNFVPTFGPIVGGVIGGFLILLVNPMGTVWFVIYTLISQFCDGNLLKPKLFGDPTGLRPMWVLASIIICGGLFGVVGMILGVPLFAIISDIVNERVEKRIQRWDCYRK